MVTDKDDLIYAGKLGKAHGLKGELKIYPEEAFEEDLMQMDFLLLQTANQMLPFFIENIRGEGFLIVKFEGYNDRGQVLELEKKDFYFKKELLLYPLDEYTQEEESEYGYLTGYKSVDTSGNDLGVISAVEEYPQQEMATIVKGEKSCLIPLVRAFIQKIDDSQKIIVLDLPEGLMDL